MIYDETTLSNHNGWNPVRSFDAMGWSRTLRGRQGLALLNVVSDSTLLRGGFIAQDICSDWHRGQGYVPCSPLEDDQTTSTSTHPFHPERDCLLNACSFLTMIKCGHASQSFHHVHAHHGSLARELHKITETTLFVASSKNSHFFLQPDSFSTTLFSGL